MSERKPFLLRIDAELWREVERWAQEELRSVNGQIEFLLRQAVLRRRRAAAEGSAPRPPAAGEGLGSDGTEEGG
ncbi:MAG: Arc family DNA-binding protein [Planctomycetes bacterium]|nr:Arc family DNA-binding protein [Planctomycetota bacterium]